MVAETRHWVMRDLRNGHGRSVNSTGSESAKVKQHVHELFQLFGKAGIERWNDATWESLSLQLLWRICRDGTRQVATERTRHREFPTRHAELLKQATSDDCDVLVNDLLIRFCAAFLDQGYANWSLPYREEGFLRSFAKMYSHSTLPTRWLRGLRQEMQRLVDDSTDPFDLIDQSLVALGVVGAEQDAFVLATLEALPGWAGMIWQMESNAEWTLRPAPQGTLVEFLAVRLILDRLAAAYVAKNTLHWNGKLRDLRGTLRDRIPDDVSRRDEQIAFLVFQLAQVRGWLPQDLHRLPAAEWKQLVEELEDFSSFNRRRIFHRAYERRYRNQALDALLIQCQRRRPWAHESSPRREEAPPISGFPRLMPDAHERTEAATTNGMTPSFQIVCCIDDREESFRRHLEEIDPSCETLATAGFFGVAMYYRSASDAHARPLCPVIIKPQHYVNEEVAYTFVKEHRRRAETRRVLGSASHQVHLGSRTFLGGALTALTGSLASIPLVTRILFPRATAQVRRLFGGLLRPPAVTQLCLERTESEPGPSPGHVGYSLNEMIAIVERLLRDIGVTQYFAPIVIICGHGSSSLNNPHESAYNCGACSGGRGGPNARAYAEMANDIRVREALAARGLDIPSETSFVGAFHNTCDDSVTFYDLDRLAPKQRNHFEMICDVVDEARRRNAHERCRRFESAPLSLSFEAALKHVEGRSEDLSQARPEYNHATNALCLVGQRWWSRGLFADRRAFLQSYDPTKDDEQSTILARILAAVIPVCAGISLEYYFSCVDPTVLGCGSKLPHNITSLLGVMEGAASDLRPGLSQQMIEIHEPMRILFVIETTPDAMLSIMQRNEVIARLCRNEWVQLAVLDAERQTIQIFRNGMFEPYRMRTDSIPTANSSADWYRGWRAHLGFAQIELK